MNMSETTTRRVWGIGTSRTLRVHWMLAELELEYETRPILTRTERMEDPGFRALSGRGKIPLFEDGDVMIGESAAISLFLADRYRDHAALVPPLGSDERAVHDELCFFIMTEMDALLYVIRRHEGLPDIYGRSETACDAARDYFARSAEETERRLGGGSNYSRFAPGLQRENRFAPRLCEGNRDQLHARSDRRTHSQPFERHSA
jgi:glutathione S-transferase